MNINIWAGVPLIASCITLRRPNKCQRAILIRINFSFRSALPNMPVLKPDKSLRRKCQSANWAHNKTLGLLIKKRDAAFKRGDCESAMPGGGYAGSFNVAHVWRVILQAACWLSSARPLWETRCNRSLSRRCHIAVNKKYDCPMSLFACRVIYIQFPLRRSRGGGGLPRPGEALFPPHTQRINNGTVSSSSRLITQVVTGRAAKSSKWSQFH